MIRQPIERRSQILLGVASVCLLVLLYAGLSHRQHRANPKDTTIPNLSQFVAGWRLLGDQGRRRRRLDRRGRRGDLRPAFRRVGGGHSAGRRGGHRHGLLCPARVLLPSAAELSGQDPAHRDAGRLFRPGRHRAEDVHGDGRAGCLSDAGPGHLPGGQEGRQRQRHLQGLHAGGLALRDDLQRRLQADPAADPRERPPADRPGHGVSHRRRMGRGRRRVRLPPATSRAAC